MVNYGTLKLINYLEWALHLDMIVERNSLHTALKSMSNIYEIQNENWNIRKFCQLTYEIFFCSGEKHFIFTRISVKAILLAMDWHLNTEGTTDIVLYCINICQVPRQKLEILFETPCSDNPQAQATVNAWKKMYDSYHIWISCPLFNLLLTNY